MKVTLLDASSPHWGSEVERIGVELGAGQNPTLFPYHFLFVTLSKIGGHIATFEEGGRRTGIGFLFPRGTARPVGEDAAHLHAALPQPAGARNSR